MKQIIISLILSLILFSCANTSNLRKICYSWLGANINDLVDSWGYPDHEFEAPNGNTVYAYESGRSMTTPMYIDSDGYGRSTVHGGHTFVLYCIRYFEVENDIIIKYRLEGNDCKATNGQVDLDSNKW